MRHIKRPAIRTQFLIFNLFGDYVNPRGIAVWTSGLLEVLKVLGVSERAARSTLSRMKNKGWLKARREGRRSLYQLTDKGKTLLDEGTRRLFGPPPSHWDGRWHLVIYSLPQHMRAVRHELRTRLSWLGYGMLQPGTMVAAHAREQEVEALIRELDVAEYLHRFSQARLEAVSDRHIVARCWDLPDLNRRYTEFIQRHRPAYLRLRTRHKRGRSLPPEECFVQRFWLTYEFASFPRQDPNLPPELLPDDWRGRDAAALLADYRALLKAPAETYICETLGIRAHADPAREAVTVMAA